MAKPDLLYVPNKEEGYVYHWFNASPSQHGDFNLFTAQNEGWDAVLDLSKVPTDILNRVGQSSDSPGGGVVRRGDLVLYRMPREQWERTVHAETEANRSRMATTIDTMVAQAHEQAAKALKDRGQSRIPSKLVFREDPSLPSD